MPTSPAVRIQLMINMSAFVRSAPRAPVTANGHADCMIGMTSFDEKFEKSWRRYGRSIQSARSAPMVVPAAYAHPNARASLKRMSAMNPRMTIKRFVNRNIRASHSIFSFARMNEEKNSRSVSPIMMSAVTGRRNFAPGRRVNIGPTKSTKRTTSVMRTTFM